jgi:hypothetical protein
MRSLIPTVDGDFGELKFANLILSEDHAERQAVITPSCSPAATASSSPLAHTPRGQLLTLGSAPYGGFSPLQRLPGRSAHTHGDLGALKCRPCCRRSVKQFLFVPNDGLIPKPTTAKSSSAPVSLAAKMPGASFLHAGLRLALVRPPVLQTNGGSA